MLDLQQSPNKQFQFLKLIRQEEEDGTQETQLMTALRVERTSTPDVHATEEQSTPEELEEDKWLTESLRSDKKPNNSALEELKKLADIAVQRTEQQYREAEQARKAMQELEALANKLEQPVKQETTEETMNKDEEPVSPEKQPTAYMPALPRQINPVTPIPPSILPAEEPAQEKSQERNSDPLMKPNLSDYYMKDISPLILIWGAIGEHMSKYRNSIPLCVYVSKRLITLLADDVRRIMGSDVLFYGYVPFPTPEGTVPISVRIKESMGISVHKVECIS
jgi:hypothetical protein